MMLYYKLVISLLSVLAWTKCCRTTSSFSNPSAELSWNNNIELLEQQTKNVTFRLSQPLNKNVVLHFNTSHEHSSKKNVSPAVYSHMLTIRANSSKENLEVTSQAVGQIVIAINVSDPDVKLLSSNRVRVYVIESHALKIVNIVIGWMYFVAWSVSFYPQVVLNYQRKSVVGLNFDFLAYNITGFLAYCLYNIGLFWIPLVQQQYIARYPDGVIPVQANDVFFTLHASVITALTIFQCFIYERADQKVSILARVLVALTWLAMFILLFVTVGNKISWLDYLTVFSYVKLGVTLIKYVPQVVMNYRRKSTVGWSIGNVLLDFTGGFLSILQMILQSYNNDEWDLVFGDPTKFGLGLFSILFDIIFMVQHYILYRPKKDSSPLLNENLSDEEDDDTYYGASS